MTARFAHAACVAAWFALFALQLAWWAWLAPPETLPRLVPIVVCAGPLLLVLNGLLHERPRAHFWFAILVLPYFAVGVAAGYASNPLGWIQAALTAVAFAAAFTRNRAVRAPGES